MKSQEGPDQKWSWVVACSCFFISLILFGIYRTSGILLVAFVHEYGVTREESSWPLFLCFSIVDLTGLLVGPLGQKFGVRPITIVGSLISAAGVCLCFFANSLTFITISFGVIFGVGFGFAITLMPVIINEYFLKYRVTANGIANSGGCFGSVIFPPVYEYFLQTYGLNGCLLLTGGIILQLVISGALMRPPPWLKSIKRVGENGENQVGQLQASEYASKNSNANFTLHETKRLLTVEEERSSFPNLQEGNINRTDDASQQIVDRHGKNIESTSIFHEEGVVGRSNQTSLECENSNNQSEMGHGVSRDVQVKFSTCSDVPRNISHHDEGFKKGSFSETNDSQRHTNNVSQSYIETVPDLSGIKDSEESPFLRTKTEIALIAMDGKYSSQEIKTFETNELTTAVEKVHEESHLTILESFKIVLSCPMFYIIGLTNVIFFSSEEMFYVINADFYIDKNTSEEDVKYMIFAFSVCDLAGRLCFGWVTDRKYLSKPNFMSLTMVAIAVAYFVFPYANSYIQLLAMNGVYGLLIGMTTIVLFVLPADYLDMDIQAVAYGSIAFLCGTLTLMFSLLIGHFRDNFGSYSSIFYIMGAVSICNAVFWVFEKYFANCRLSSKHVPRRESAGTPSI